MSRSRSIMLLGSLGLVVLLVAAWFLVLSPRMSTVSNLNAQRDGVDAANASTEQNIKELTLEKSNIGTAKAEADALSSRFPATAAQSDLFTLIRQDAVQAGIPENAITDITVGTPALGAANGAATLPTAPTTASAAPSPATPSAASDPNAAPAPAVPAADPAGAGNGLGTMTLDITVNASSAKITKFLAALENMTRAYLVNSVTLGSSTNGSGTATISGTMYLLQKLPDPTAPQASTSPAPTATSSSGGTTTQ